MSARGELSPLAQLVEEFVTAAVSCSGCEVLAGCSCDGPVCRPRRSAALERYIVNQDFRRAIAPGGPHRDRRT